MKGGKTYGELRKDAVYNISTFEKCKPDKKRIEGVVTYKETPYQRIEGTVTYKGIPYHIRAYAYEDTDRAWDEAVIVALAKALLKA